jgi:hypothetical protein
LPVSAVPICSVNSRLAACTTTWSSVTSSVEPVVAMTPSLEVNTPVPLRIGTSYSPRMTETSPVEWSMWAMSAMAETSIRTSAAFAPSTPLTSSPPCSAGSAGAAPAGAPVPRQTSAVSSRTAPVRGHRPRRRRSRGPPPA